MDVITEGKKIQNELVELRRYFHEHPELPWEEFNTQKKIMEYLDELGIPYQESSKTGVIATIKGPHSSDKILGIRADIDALPITEQAACEWKSQNEGKMHACGHDTHITMLLGAAKLLKQMEDELKELAKVSIEAARDKLMDILCNYQGYKKCVLILVFDAYKVEGYALEIQKYHNIHVVYTKEAETADQYIEKVVHHIGRKYHVTVVTSDGVEQVITMGQGGTRISSRDFLEEIEYTKKLIEEDNEKQRVSDRNYLFDHADDEFVKKMEKIRLGRESE